MVKWNLMNLLHRFGKPQEHNGVVLSVGAAVKLYKHRLGGSLLEHANGLGHRTIVELLRSLFDDNALRETGVQVSRSGPKNELFLTSSLSLRLARESAYKAEFVQFQPSGDDAERMVHTGTTFQLPQKDKYQTFSMPDIVQPLSAAVRISQADAESGRFQTGMECNAFVHTYDAKGDNGSPLLTCAIDPPRGQIRNQMKRRAYVKRQIDAKQTRKTNDEVIGSGGAERDLNELKVGDGPYTAAVVRVSTRAGAAFVDLGVHRQMGKKSGGGTAKVLAMLRFDDIVDNMSSEDTDPEAALIEASLLEGSDEEELFTVEDLFMDEEEEVDEDVTDMYSIDEDGTVSAVDTSTGETKIIGSANSEDDDDDDDSEEEDDDNMFAGMSPEERLRAIGEMLEAEEPAKRVESKKTAAAKVDSRLKQGDKIDVYVRAVFPQSGRFMVTLNPAIKGRKMKDMKREKEAEKRLERLTSKMGGGDGLQDILSSIGLIMEGSVKAKSNTGDWYYVQPDVEGFPVGIAKSDVQGALTPGQKAKIRIDGIDETRGQLALTILESLD
eukprot:CAMPEP_0197246206 /NCGR_PEP_ID=MMETSP1429-20130617/10724_1 /TAXON_ID=49237 /ORGANISM="Chaetoceros  sp., Strain UNC1202" /LENGTH=552 /DNA_ID=CAMNT_0042706821 /DNA_START=71 /DNA_END=1729 /DNA_ORIENTATION=+